MRILLDECLPRKLRPFLRGHNSLTVQQAGFAGKKNGALLLAAAEAEFDVLITVDNGIPHQQNTTSLPLAILIIQARSNHLPDLVPLIPSILAALDRIQPGGIARVAVP
jgi:predicted nuclease of predicted toxin-antitoxin system